LSINSGAMGTPRSQSAWGDKEKPTIGAGYCPNTPRHISDKIPPHIKKPPEAVCFRGRMSFRCGLALFDIYVGADIFTFIKLAWTANFELRIVELLFPL